MAKHNADTIEVTPNQLNETIHIAGESIGISGTTLKPVIIVKDINKSTKAFIYRIAKLQEDGVLIAENDDNTGTTK